jgi:hypothetical protein
MRHREPLVTPLVRRRASDGDGSRTQPNALLSLRRAAWSMPKTSIKEPQPGEARAPDR